MGRGFLSGIFWGGIVGIVLLGVSSQVLDRQELSLPQPEASAVEVPGGSEFDQARPETDPVLPSSEGRPAANDVAGVQVPEDADDAPPAMDTTALEVPVPSTTQNAPETLGEAPEQVADGEQPSATADSEIALSDGEELEAPESPGTAPVADVTQPAATDAAPSQDDAPAVSQSEDANVESEGEVATLPAADDTASQPTTDAAPQVAGQTEAPASPAAPETTDIAALPSDQQPGDTTIGQAPEAPALPSVTSEPSLPVAGTGAPETPTVSEPQEEPRQITEIVVVEPDEPADAGEEDASGTDTGGSSTVPVVRRLGNSGTAEAEAEASEDAAEELAESDGEAAVEDAEIPTGPALQAYGSGFENTGGLPLLSFVLVHDPANAVTADQLAVLPEHVAFAVDASLPDARGIAANYRANGREVVMIPALPSGATPQDVEQALASNLEMIPEAVALMDVSGSSFQSDRAAVAQVVDVVSDTGHGLITFPRGLNSAHQQAQRAGVPTGLIFRNLDDSGQDQEQIRRSMDRAAFRARQDEAIILVGTGSGATLSAIVEWSSGNRATTVAIAPVSAALGGF